MELIINSELSQQIQDIDFAGSSAASSELVKAGSSSWFLLLV